MLDYGKKVNERLIKPIFGLYYVEFVINSIGRCKMQNKQINAALRTQKETELELVSSGLNSIQVTIPLSSIANSAHRLASMVNSPELLLCRSVFRVILFEIIGPCAVGVTQLVRVTAGTQSVVSSSIGVLALFIQTSI